MVRSDVQVTSLSNLCITCWLLGRVTEAVAHGQGALEYADQLSHAHTSGYAYAHVCMLPHGAEKRLFECSKCACVPKSLPLREMDAKPAHQRAKEAAREADRRGLCVVIRMEGYGGGTGAAIPAIKLLEPRLIGR